MSTLTLLAVLTLIAISAYLSASEVALFSLSRIQLRQLRENSRTAHRKIKKLLSDPGGVLITILVLNELVNISISTIIAKHVAESPGRWHAPGLSRLPEWMVETIIGVLITSPIILIACDITPKGIAARINQILAPAVVNQLTRIYDLLKPIRFLLQRLLLFVDQALSRFSRPHSKSQKRDLDQIEENELIGLAEDAVKEGAIDQKELDLIRAVLKLDDVTVAELHTPLHQMLTLSQDASIRTAIQKVRGHAINRVPVIGSNKRSVVGILYTKDLVQAQFDSQIMEASVQSMMRKTFTVPSNMRLDTLFRRLKQTRTHIAVVEESPGVALGIVTLDDIIDSVFEEGEVEE